MFVWVIKILQYEKIDVSEGIDTNKTSASTEFEVGFRFEPHVCNKCHGLLMTAYELKKHWYIKCNRSWF